MNNTAPEEQICLTSRVRHRAVADDGVLINLESGRVVVVNEVGLHIVQELTSPKTRQGLVDSIIGHFDIDAEQATADLEIYLAELESDQILERQSVPS